LAPALVHESVNGQNGDKPKQHLKVKVQSNYFIVHPKVDQRAGLQF